MTTTKEITQASAILKALSNPARLQIVTLLLSGEKNVAELNKSVRVSQPLLSQHLWKLKQAGIVSGRRESRKIFYYIVSPHAVRILGTVFEAVRPAVKKVA